MRSRSPDSSGRSVRRRNYHINARHSAMSRKISALHQAKCTFPAATRAPVDVRRPHLDSTSSFTLSHRRIDCIFEQFPVPFARARLFQRPRGDNVNAWKRSDCLVFGNSVYRRIDEREPHANMCTTSKCHRKKSGAVCARIVASRTL